MKGYRTVIFGAVVTLGGMVGWHVAPETINEYLDVVFAGIGVGILVLRFATNSPIGAKIAADLGTSPAVLNNLVTTLDPETKGDFGNAISDLSGAVDKLSGHPIFQPETLDILASLISSARSAADANAVVSTVAPAVPDPAPGVQAQQAASQPVLQTSDPAPVASAAINS